MVYGRWYVTGPGLVSMGEVRTKYGLDWWTEVSGGKWRKSREVEGSGGKWKQ